jgi:predicted aspartyl protease
MFELLSNGDLFDVRKLVLAALAAVTLAACGSSAEQSPNRVQAASAVPKSAVPSVGPTNPTQTPAPRPATVDLQVLKRNGAALVIAPVVVNGKTYQFIVDTGATATLVDTSYAKALGLKNAGKAPIPVTGVTGSGSAYLATISHWKIGRASIPTSTVTVSTIHIGTGIVGLLGSDVLSTFGKVTIDYNAQKASLG